MFEINICIDTPKFIESKILEKKIKYHYIPETQRMTLFFLQRLKQKAMKHKSF